MGVDLLIIYIQVIELTNKNLLSGKKWYFPGLKGNE